MLPLLLGGGRDGSEQALELECPGQKGLCQLHLRGLDTVSQLACTPSSLSVKWGSQGSLLMGLLWGFRPRGLAGGQGSFPAGA